MGLDMYLEGRKSRSCWDVDKEKQPQEDGFPIENRTTVLELGYWRKHPNLHGYIVEKYADGVDECQEIPLDADALRDILRASEADELPHTEGFFFGVSCPEDKESTREQLEAAIKWLETEDPEHIVDRAVVYRASW